MQFRNIAEDSQIEIYFETFGQDKELIAPSAAFTASDFVIYKNGSATQKTTTNGITVTSPFDSVDGTHLIIVDTSNDTGDVGFWEIGGRYQIKFNTAKTVDGKSIDGRCVPRGAFGIQSEYTVDVPTAEENANEVRIELATELAEISTTNTKVGTLETRLTAQRATNLDNLDVAISVIQSQITALNNLSAKANWFGALLLEVPDSASRVYQFELVVKDDEDKLANLDGSPTIALVNAAGTDRSSLITTGIANPATGRYTLAISVGTSTTNESLKLTASGTISGETRYAVICPQVVDYDSATQINTILTRLGTPSVTVSDDLLALTSIIGNPDPFGDIVESLDDVRTKINSTNTALGTPVTSIAADIASVKTDTGNLTTRITSTRAEYLDSVILAQNSNRTVQITGSHHIAADIHAFQQDVIDSGAISSSAVNKLQFGIATSGDLNNVSQRLPSGLINGSIRSYVYEIENDAVNVAATDANLITWIQDGIATSSDVASVRVLTSGIKNKTDQLTFSIPNKVDINSSGIEISGGGSISPSDIRSAIGLASANLDIQLSNIPSGVVSYSMPESYAGSGAIMSVSQAMYMIHQMLSDFAISGALISVKKLDGSEAASFRLDNSSRPTSKERVS